MKKLALSVIAILCISMASNAQAFQKEGKYISLGLGGSSFWHIYTDASYNSYYGFGGYSPITGQLSVQGEFGVHKYVGVGFTTGIGGRAGGGVSRFGYGYGYSPEFNIPIGLIANFHFYQLIADKVSKDIHADKLDVYAGLNIGSGVAILPNSGSTQIAALFFAGPQVGVRYFFKPNIAVNGELGYGKTWVNAGLTFKVGK